MTPHVFFGFLSTAMMAASRLSYFTSIFRGHTKPHSFSWLIWAVISTIGFAAQWSEGAGPGAWARGLSAATCFILAVLGWTHGEREITRGDRLTLIVAFLTIPLWVMTKTPVWSVIIVVCIDLIGYLPTVRKVLLRPGEETPVSYILSCLCAFFSLMAIEHMNLSTWLYPVSLTFSNGAMAGLILYRRKRAKLLISPLENATT